MIFFTCAFNVPRVHKLMCRIWELSDIDVDGYLDPDELALAMYLIRSAQHEGTVPSVLPAALVPPSKRR